MGVGKQSFDRRIEEIAALRSAAEDVALEQLRRALKDRSNYVVSKAAAMTGDRQQQALVPDLVAAFDRFLRNPVKTDPQCWAKNAIAKALKDLGYSSPDLFLRGMEHFQPEPVWGGHEDSATALRGICALALTACDLPSFDVLVHLTVLLNDPAAPVRIDAARAMAQLSAREAVLPLQLKSLVGDREPEVVGQCLAALLSLSPHDHLPFVAKFLDNHETALALEAAGALAESREPEAVERLQRFWETAKDSQLKRSVLGFLGGSPLEEAAGFLFSVFEDGPEQYAADALAALSKNRYRARFRERAAVVVAGRGNSELAELVKQLAE